MEHLDSLIVVEAFDFASDLEADIRSNSDRSLDNNTPSMDCFVDRTSIGAAVSLAVESLGLHNDGEMENRDH